MAARRNLSLQASSARSRLLLRFATSAGAGFLLFASTGWCGACAWAGYFQGRRQIFPVGFARGGLACDLDDRRPAAVERPVRSHSGAPQKAS